MASLCALTASSLAIAASDSPVTSVSARLDPSGSMLAWPDKKSRGLSVFSVATTPIARSISAGPFPLDGELPFSLSPGGRFLVGAEADTATGGYAIVAYETSTSLRIGSVGLPGNVPPDALWINSKGSVFGALVQGQFVAYPIAPATTAPKPSFAKASTLLLGSPDGRFVMLASDSGNLSLIDSEDWGEAEPVQSSIERAVQRWFAEKQMRQEVPKGQGPFTWPVEPVSITPDNRVVTVSLGENANMFLNICMSSGDLVSSIELDKHVDARMRSRTSGRLFAIQVVPAGDDPKFRRPRADYGLRIYDIYSGKKLSTVGIADADWARYRTLGAKHILDEWSGWLGLAAGDKSAIRLDAKSGRPVLDSLRTRQSLLPSDASAVAHCVPLGG